MRSQPASPSLEPARARGGLRDGHPPADFTAVTGDFVCFVLGTQMRCFAKVGGCLCCFAILKSRVSIWLGHQKSVAFLEVIFKNKNTKTFSLCKN